MVVKLRLVFSITILFFSFCGSAQVDYWKQLTTTNSKVDSQIKSLSVNNGQQFSLGIKDFRNTLKGVAKSDNRGATLYFPNGTGRSVAYKVFETPVLSPELSAKYPSIKSYTGYGIKDRAEKIRFSISNSGLQAMMVHGDGTTNSYIQQVTGNRYILYRRDGLTRKEDNFVCSTTAKIVSRPITNALKPVDDQELRKFRLAVSTTGEYTEYHGGTVVDALAAINATITRVNEVFERDLGITLELVPNTDMVIFTNAATDPYNGNLSGQVQTVLNDNIGAANYDIGHLFHRDQANGNAGFVGAVCIDNRKGSAFSSHPDPMGDLFDLDYVAHEMGHQFGANHTWSFESEGTTVQVEPGSGTTIMGYAGIADDDNVAPNGDDYFHHSSIEQISDYLETINCAEVISLANNPPTIVPTGDFTIPKSTAFALSGNASDLDTGDVLTYAWEQVDNGIVTQATFGPTNPTGANFRSQRPSVDSVRYFPKLARIVSGELTQENPPISSAWETVSDVQREMNFALTVRDNAMGGGQLDTDLVKILVVDNAGPFLVTSQTTGETYAAGDVMPITWDVANTNLPPVNSQMVDILLSTDGGLTFVTTLATGVPNDGQHNVIVPALPTSTARLMVKASDNVFLAVNDANFTISESEIVLNFSELEFDVCQPDSISTSFDYESYLGFSEEVTFSISSAPANLIASFTPPVTNMDTTIDMVLSNTENVEEGNHEVVVMATSTSITKMVTLNINIFASGFTDVVLTAPVDGQTNASVKSNLQWEANPAYTSYGLEIATDLAFTNIVESATLTMNSYVPQSLMNETTYFWRVKPINACGEGNFGTPFSFTTIEFNCTNKSAGNLPLEITAVGTPTIESKIAFFEDLTLADINVSVDVDHSFLSDLVVSLISPAGTTVVLLSSSCGDLKNVDATFDDDAVDFVCGGDPAIDGTVRPLGALSAFNGESILGEWTLRISDNAPSDGGSLNAFSLEVCVEGQFRPDVDGDGVFDDGDDLCLGTPVGTTVDANGCPVLIFPEDNFSLSLQSESCRTASDGSVSIDARMQLDYEITAAGPGLDMTDSFTTTYTLPNLSAGTYSICLNATDGMDTYEEQCFEVVITEPEPLGVGSKVSTDGQSVVLSLSGGGLYNIDLNGELMQTSLPEISLDFKKGLNTLKISTDLPCQGIHEEVFFNSNEPILSPNPTANSTKVFLGFIEDEITISLFSEDGRFVRSKKMQVNGNEIDLDLTGLASGIYYVRFEGTAVKGTVKVIKL